MFKEFIESVSALVEQAIEQAHLLRRDEVARHYKSFDGYHTISRSIMNLETDMTLTEQIQRQLSTLPPKKQNEVLDFVAFLQQRVSQTHPAPQLSLKQHPVFGAWKNRDIDTIKYQQELRAEWDAII